MATIESMLGTCPEWCIAPTKSGEHKVALTTAEFGRVEVVVTHPGATFGSFRTDAEVSVLGDYPSVELPNSPWGSHGFDTPDQLRQHAAEALAAAEWLEARQ